ncbi:MAG: gamma-glutamyltransferase family protein [Treponema sp.]|jgi:gamma-glutamyltranspeptidase/glutathione hydrolase|nr:gamma-glutamyltransferase family protein [Treponema sp.]
MKNDPHYLPYPSRRQLIYARRGVVATSQPLAAQAALDILKAGGNAFDAIVACAAAMTVLEPCSNGLGGDAFAILWPAKEGRLLGLNSSGPAPALMNEENIRSRGYAAMPRIGPAAVTVPGIPAAWAAISARYGRFSLGETVEAAAVLAEEGYPASPLTARGWKQSFEDYRREREIAGGGGGIMEGPEVFDGWFRVFAAGTPFPSPGDLVRLSAMAETIREIGRTGSESYYRGEIAADIDAYMKKTGGFLRAEDLGAFYPEWVEPIGVNYRGFDIWEIPPNGQGMTALMALKILENFGFPQGKDHPDTLHRQIESLKLAFADAHAYIADPRVTPVDAAALLSGEYARERSALIGEEALEPRSGKPEASGTVYLCAADGEGNMVSYIQSNYSGFGSGLVLPERGIAFQNRGFGFNLDRNSVKYVRPGKRPFHTIIPGFITRDGLPLGPFGIMGGPMQPQAHLQVVSSLVDFGLNPQAALDAPRWQWVEGKKILLEPAYPLHVAAALGRRGHQVSYELNEGSFGRGQIIMRLPNGTYTAATEGRADGYVAAW